jgi:hypothetical protein
LKKQIFHIIGYILIGFWSFCGQDISAQQLGQNCPEDLIPRQDKHTRLFGFANLAGEWLIPAHYVKVFPFVGNKAVVMLGTKLGVINCEGYLVIPAEYDDFTIFNVDKTWAKKAGDWSLINDQGKVLVSEKMSDVRTIQPEYDFIWVKKNDLWGIFSERSLQFTAKPQFDMFQVISEAASIVKTGDSLGVISHDDGSFFIKQNVSNINKLTKTAFAFKQRGKWGVFDDEGAFWMKPEYDTISLANSKLLNVKKDGLFGVIDFKEKEVIPIKYEMISSFNNGLAMVKQGGKFGFMNQHGKIISPIAFDTAHDFKNGYSIVKINGLYGVIDVNNKFSLKPEYENVIRNYNTLTNSLPFYGIKKEGKWTLLGSRMEKISEDSFDSLCINDTTSFMRVMVNQKYRFYNVTKGSYELANTFTAAQEFRNGMAIVGIEGKFGVINDKGLFLVPALYEAIDYEFLNGKYIFYVKLNGKIGVQGLDGKLIVPCEYDLLVTSDSKFFKAQKNGKYGVLKISGQECVAFKYSFLSNGKETIGVPEWPCISADGKRFGLIDAKGEELIKPIYDQIFYLGEGLYGYQKKKDFGIVRANGVMLVENDFSALTPFVDKIAMAKKGDNWGYIALGGKFFIQPNYQEITPFVKNFACVKSDGLWGIIDKSGKYLRKPEFEDYKDFGNGNRRFYKNGKEFKIDEFGVVK